MHLGPSLYHQVFFLITHKSALNVKFSQQQPEKSCVRGEAVSQKSGPILIGPQRYSANNKGCYLVERSGGVFVCSCNVTCPGQRHIRCKIIGYYSNEWVKHGQFNSSSCVFFIRTQ